MAAQWCPPCIDLDTLYIWCFQSGMAGTGLNHSMYARWFGGVMFMDGNTSLITLLGIWNTMWTWAIQTSKVEIKRFWNVSKSELLYLWAPCSEPQQYQTVKGWSAYASPLTLAKCAQSLLSPFYPSRHDSWIWIMVYRDMRKWYESVTWKIMKCAWSSSRIVDPSNEIF